MTDRSRPYNKGLARAGAMPHAPLPTHPLPCLTPRDQGCPVASTSVWTTTGQHTAPLRGGGAMEATPLLRAGPQNGVPMASPSDPHASTTPTRTHKVATDPATPCFLPPLTPATQHGTGTPRTAATRGGSPPGQLHPCDLVHGRTGIPYAGWLL
jgi:hypothetical protein